MIAAIAMVAEARIREALKRGEFDNLPGKGQPLDLDEDANIPEELRMAYKLLKNGGYLQDEAIKSGNQDPVNLDALLSGNPDERGKVRQMLKLQVLEARMGGRAQRQIKLDADDVYYGKVVDRITVAGTGKGK